MVQVAPAASVALDRVTLPTEIEVTPRPTQLPVGSTTGAVTPAGSVSVKETPVSGAALGLLRVIRTFEVPPARIVDGVKDFVIVGATKGATVNVAEAGAPGSASFEATVEVVLT